MKTAARCLLPALALASAGAAAAPAWTLEAGVIGGEGSRALLRPAPDYFGIKLDGRAKTDLGPGAVSVRAAVDGELGTRIGARRVDVELQEAEYAWAVDQWDFAVGRQRILWGRADGFNPTDIWTPRAFDRPTLTDAEQYRGADTLRVTRLADLAGQWSVLLLPHFRPSEYGSGLFADLPSSPAASSAVTPRRPGWAVRYDTLGNGLDYSVTVAQTAELTPYVRPDAGAGLQARYGRLTMVGADAAYAAGAWIYRAETAWRRREDDLTQLAPADTLDAVLGVEREIGEQWTGTVQLISTSNRGALPATEGSFAVLGALNRSLFHQQRAAYTGASLALNLRPGQSGQFSITLAAYSGGERYFRARGEYPLDDRFKIGALFERYAGPSGSSFDLLSRNNVAWLTLSTSFGSL